MGEVMEWREFKNSKTMADALSFLQDKGWEITKSKFYNHCGEGKCGKNRAGYYTWRGLKKYAETHLVRSDSGESVEAESSRLVEKKIREEIKRLEIKNRRELFAEEVERGKYLPRADIERELCSRGLVLDSGLSHFLRSRAPELIAMVKGEQKYLPELIEYLMVKKDELMDGFARMADFEIELAPLGPPSAGEEDDDERDDD